MSQNPQKPKPDQPLTPAQQKRQNVIQSRQERDRREREAQQQGRLLLIATIGVIVVVIAGLIIFAVLNGQNKNNSNATTNGNTPIAAAQPTGAASGTVANAQGGVPPVNGNEITTASGLRYIDTQVGTGATPTAGQTITANYTGYLESGKVFDSSVGAGRKPFSFKLGAGQVIKGWDEGFASMKVGGKRRLIIPPTLGYGAQDVGSGLIPANSTLIFDVELLDTK